MKLRCIADCKLKNEEVKAGQIVEVENSLIGKAINSGCFTKIAKEKANEKKEIVWTTDINESPNDRQMKPRRRR